MNEPERKQDLAYWKERYFSALKELDTKERDWSQLERVLQRCVGRLAIVAGGMSAELDERLDALRDAVRDGGRQQELERLTAEIGALATARGERATGHSEAPTTPETRGAVGPAETLGMLVRHLRDAPRLAAPARDALRRLTADDTALVDTASAANAIAEALATEAQRDDVTASECLAILVERLQFPAAFQGRVDALRARFDAHPDREGTLRGLEDLAELVGEVHAALQREKREVEDFLREITERLHDLDQNLQHAGSARRDALADGQTLQRSMASEVAQIERSLAEEPDAGTLRLTVQRRLDAVNQHVRSFVQREEQRARAAESAYAQTAERLRRTEARTEELKRHLHEQQAKASTDALTGLPNRFAYEGTVARAFDPGPGPSSTLSLAVVDIDHFKRINDRYGHLAGDKALKTLAQQLEQRIPAGDFIARYGGEEFVIVMAGSALPEALARLDELRGQIAECPFNYRGEPVALTVSGGIAQRAPGDTPATLFERADQALYRAKNDGRNRCYADETTRTPAA